MRVGPTKLCRRIDGLNSETLGLPKWPQVFVVWGQPALAEPSLTIMINA
jgi:hypothetical protein